MMIAFSIGRMLSRLRELVGSSHLRKEPCWLFVLIHAATGSKHARLQPHTGIQPKPRALCYSVYCLVHTRIGYNTSITLFTFGHRPPA